MCNDKLPHPVSFYTGVEKTLEGGRKGGKGEEEGGKEGGGREKGGKEGERRRGRVETSSQLYQSQSVLTGSSWM